MAPATSKPSNEQKVLDALAAKGEATVDEVGAAAGIGRTSTRKYLAELKHKGKVKRTPGGREGKRKLPDRFALIGEEPNAPLPPEPPQKVSGERLRPGQLDGLVLDYLREHGQEGPLSPTTVAKALGRSSGAVGNCLARLAGAGKVNQASERPRRYTLGGEGS